jgi:hypothetical protein
MRPVRIIAAVLFAATVTMLTLLAAPAWAAPATPPVVVHVSPVPVVAGRTVTMSGSVGPDAAASECSSGAVLLYSDAFATTNDLGYMVAVYPTVKPDGTFTATTTIPRSKPAGTYPIALRCAGATLGGATLVVRAAPTTPAAAIHVSPGSIVPGDAVTVSGSVGPDAAGSECASRVTLLSKAFVHTQDFAGLPAVFAAVKPGGAFTTATRIPRSKPAGAYTITGRCGGGNLGVSATLAIRAAAAPTTTPAPAPPATTPPATQPHVAAPAVAGLLTQPPAQPATRAAAQLASRWIVPGLAALGSGTLAALGVWLLYRRRHPAGFSRRGRSRMAH